MKDKGNALNRLMNKRSRPTVQPRADVVSESISQDVKTSLSQDIKTDVNIDMKNSLSQNTKTDVNKDIQTGLPIDMPKMVRSTTRLDESIDTALRHLCTDYKLTKEVWFEAAYLYLCEHPEAMEAVNELAHERLQQRKQVADLRRAQTMKKKLESRFSLSENTD